MPAAVCDDSDEALRAKLGHGASTKSTIAIVECLQDGSGQVDSRGPDHLRRSEGISAQGEA